MVIRPIRLIDEIINSSSIPSATPTATNTAAATATFTPTNTPANPPTATQTPTDTPTLTPTFTPTPIVAGPLTIDYTYDALNRLTGATYSDGRNFGYTYDPAGNVLQLQQNLGPGTVTTTYNYDAANQLNTAQQGSATWQYTYDANGSLISDGVKTYTYDSANRLKTVTSNQSSVNLAYNGLGQRLSMDAAGVIAHYVMDGDQPLTADSNGNTTFYLYGLGAIAEKTNTWSYSLPDGTNTPRQLTNTNREITLASRYTPWGDTLDTYGTGNFTFGYFGGVMDAATGLLYVGNGQYYDAATGRFLTRDAKPNNSNPYVPWNPIGAIVGPLGLLSMFYSRKKKGGKGGMFLVFLLVMVTVGMTLSACGGGPTQVTAVITPDGTATITFGGTTITATVTPAPSPTNSPTAIPCPTPTLIGTPIPISSSPQKIEDVNLSAYYTSLETDYRGGKVPIKANAAKKQQVGADYLLKDTFNAYTNYEQFAQTATSDFLYDPAGLCVQGSGKLENGLYISCTDPVENIPNVGFEWYPRINEVAPLETVAICPHSSLSPFRQGDVIEIPALKAHMQSKGKDEFLTVTDTGGGLCKTDGHAETLDIYLGEGYNSSTKADYDYIRNIDKTVVFIHRGTLP